MSNSLSMPTLVASPPRTSYEAREIGRFLRQRRMLSHRENFGGLQTKRRHVPYLTQEELADLAEVAIVTISQIESARYPNLNQPLLRRICQALNLPSESETYVVNLLEEPRGLISLDDELPPWVTASVDGAAPNPAILINPGFDILYWNHAATRLLGDFGQMPASSRNVVVSMFSMPQMREMWDDWSGYAATLVAGLKMQYSLVPDYRAKLLALAEQTKAYDSTFARLWNEVDPALAPPPEKILRHPTLGTLRLYQTVSQVMGAPHLALMHFAPRDQATAEAFTRM